MKAKKIGGASASPVQLILLTGIACAGLIVASDAATVSLGAAGSFGVLAGSTVINTGPTVINGHVGLSPGTAIEGFPPGSATGAFHAADGVAIQAKTDALAAYNDLADRPVTETLTGQDLGGLTLGPGVYFFATTAQLTGTLRLDGQGLVDPIFIFQIGTALTTASDSSIIGINGATSCAVFFQVGSSATLGTDTDFLGTIIADQSITLNTGADMYGRVLALNGAVTLDTNNIDALTCIPEPASGALFAISAALLCARHRRKSVR